MRTSGANNHGGLILVASTPLRDFAVIVCEYSPPPFNELETIPPYLCQVKPLATPQIVLGAPFGF